MKQRLARLRPFLRRDLRTRLVSALAAFCVLVGLSWLGASALTQMDTEGAHDLRLRLGLERHGEVCGGAIGPACTYDDREQAQHDAADADARKMRAAVLDELALRVGSQIAKLEAIAERVQGDELTGSRTYWADDAEVRALLDHGSDLRPMASRDAEIDALTELRLSARETSPIFGMTIERRLLVLHDYERKIEAQRARDGRRGGLTTVDRATVVRDLEDGTLLPAGEFTALDLGVWFRQSGAADRASSLAVAALRKDATALHTALEPYGALWQSGWSGAEVPRAPFVRSATRYTSPVAPESRWHFFGVALLSLAGFVFLVVSPTVTATETAKEREAGTLPVLRMTGMSPGDLALAMAVGPNVFAAICGGGLLVLGGAVLTVTAGPLALVAPLTALAIMTVAINAVAIGFGDALGQRVNAMVVGALVGLGVLAPGLLGAALASLNVADTGLLLGPLPLVAAATSSLADVPGLGLNLDDAELGTAMIGYTIVAHVALGMICLGSWRRRVEQPWAPLFRPAEGVALALASIGASALSLLDISTRANTQDFDGLNLVTFVSCSFLVPLLAWLLVTSLRRPARARAVAASAEARRAFLRFPGFVLAAAAVVGMAYHFVLSGSMMASTESEVMWATLAQILLVAETGVATFLWASRRRDGKLRASLIGSLVVALQVIMTGVVYGIEVEHVARTNSAAWPFLLNVEVSSYWIAFVVLLWAAGLGLVFMALLRERERTADHPADDDWGMPGRRLVH